MDLLSREVEPLFSFMRSLGPEVATAVEKNGEFVDPQLGTVYRQRKEFEQCVALFNERVAAYLSQEELKRSNVPPYFDKHQPTV